MTRKRAVLGIDTSNYTTSLCLMREDGEIVKNIKLLLPVKEGEAGLRQSDALFSHTKNLPVVFSEAREEISKHQITAIGVSARPRDVTGSYMPCFLSGLSVASALSATLGVDMYEYSHQAGHIAAAMKSSGMNETYKEENFISFHVSGGTTEMLLCKRSGDDISARIIGKTLDLNAGQTIDRCGVMLGMPFPSGKYVEQKALSYYETHGKVGGFGVSVKGCDCCLSGLENLSRRAYTESGDAGYVCAFVIEYIAKTLIKMCKSAIEQYGDIPLLFAGGVMSCSIIKDRIRSVYPRSYFALPEFSSDNAAGVADLARVRVCGSPDNFCKE